MTLKPLGLQSLSMVASVLSAEYGVKVVSGGTEAFTTYPQHGKPVINIPAVNLQDQDYLTMVRGFIDHETGHIRFSRPQNISDKGRLGISRPGRVGLSISGLGIPGQAISNKSQSTVQNQENNAGHIEKKHSEKSAKPNALTVIFNIYEDVYVERMMGQCFPGCRRNISGLVRLLYADKRQRPLNVHEFVALQAQIPMADVAETVWAAILQYMTYFIRSREEPELERFVPEYRSVVDHLIPRLAEELEPVMFKAKTEGESTEANARLAEEAHKIILSHFQDHSNVMPGALQEDGQEDKDQGGGEGDGSGGGAGDSEKSKHKPSELMQALQNQADNYSSAEKTGADISGEAAEMLAEMIGSSDLPRPEPYETIDPETHAWKAQIGRLEKSDLDAAVRVMAHLDAQLQTLIQTLVMNRGGLARAGKLDANMLHRLATSNPRIFRRQVEKQGINTEIVLVADMSGSMLDDGKDIITSRALYAIMASLRKIPGVASSVVGFSGNKMFNILGPDSALTTYMRLRPTGHTLCGEALSYAIRNFSGAVDTRKIIFMLTDSKADNEDYFTDMIKHTRAVGVEFLGVGVMDASILQYLPREECCVVKDLNRLAPEMFRMLRNKLVGAA